LNKKAVWDSGSLKSLLWRKLREQYGFHSFVRSFRSFVFFDFCLRMSSAKRSFRTQVKTKMQTAQKIAACQARANTDSIVPKIVHQTWKTHNVPQHWETSPKMWKQLHPDWLHILWTDQDIEDIVKVYYAEYYQRFHELKYNIMRIDVFRVMVLMQFGGIYSDLDLAPKVSFEPFIHMCTKNMPELQVGIVEAPSSFGRNTGYSNFLMFSARSSLDKTEFWQRYLSQVFVTYPQDVPWYQRGAAISSKHLQVMLKTGPAAISRVFKHIKAESNGKNKSVAIIPATFVTNQKFYDIVAEQTDTNFQFQTLHGESWMSTSSRNAKNALWLYDNRDYFLCPLIAVLFIIMAVLCIYVNKYRANGKGHYI
jgi:mannosyltransferase OCH1-like enzyme